VFLLDTLLVFKRSGYNMSSISPPNNNVFKKELLRKYELSPHKLKILLIVCRYFPHKKDDYGMTPEEHIAHYFNIFKVIRSVFNVSEADLLLKLHPAEENVYESYKRQFGVKIYGDITRTEELVCLSDLYIASPSTNVNYMALGSSVPAIFMNFSTSVKSPNECLEVFSIKSTANDTEEFVRKLRQFKNGGLPKQYDNNRIDLKSLDNIVRFIG